MSSIDRVVVAATPFLPLPKISPHSKKNRTGAEGAHVDVVCEIFLLQAWSSRRQFLWKKNCWFGKKKRCGREKEGGSGEEYGSRV